VITGRITQLVSIVMIVAAVAGCGTTAQSKYYTLDSTAVSDGRPASQAAVLVGPVSVPASVDQPQFVVQVASNRVEVEEFNRWVAPLSDSIARTVAGDLTTLLGTPDVATAQLANFNADYRVTIDVQRFDSIRGQGTLLDAVWSVRKTAGGDARSGRTVAREAVQGNGFEVLAAAHSRALAQMSGDIASAIRVEAEEKPQ
jgi:uncharacterized lipoprotein YmbA